ncbi:MAG: hypothetical protein ACJAUL_003526, partial [Paraglaciecola sp.]
YGEHMNFFSSDWSGIHGRIEIFCKQDQVDSFCKTMGKRWELSGPQTVLLPYCRSKKCLHYQQLVSSSARNFRR